MLLGQPLADVEPQTAAPSRLEVVGIELHALAADLRQLIRRQAGAGVCDGDANRAGARIVKEGLLLDRNWNNGVRETIWHV